MQDRRGQLELVDHRILARAFGGAEVIERGFLLQRTAPAVVTTVILPVIGRHDDLIARVHPFADEGGQHLIHHGAGMVHLLAVVEKPVAHTVQGTGVQHAVIQPKAQAKVGQRGKQINVRRGHLVDQPVAGHRVKTAMVDGAAGGFIIFNIANVIKGMAVKKLGPEGMGHGPRDTARGAHLGKDVLFLEAEHIAVSGAAMDRRCDACMDRGIAGGRDGGQHGAVFPDARIAAVDPAFEVAKQAAEVPVGDPVKDDEEQFVVHGCLAV